MRICFIADANHPNTINWASYFSKKLNHDVHVVSFNKPERNLRNIKFHFFDTKLTSKFRYFLPTKSIKRIVHSIAPDILIGYRLTSYAFLAARTKWHPFVAVAQSQKAAGNHRIIKKPIQYLAARYAVKSADLILGWAPHMKKDIISLGGKERLSKVVTKGVDLQKFKFKLNTDNDSDTINIITTRGLNPAYNMSIVLKAISKLIEKKNIFCRIVGDGLELENLKTLAKDLNIENNVKFLGKIPYGEIENQLSKSDLYISPVPEDGVSSSLLEAMAVGVFPIVSDIEANRFWAKNGCKINFFDPYKINDLIDQVEDYILKKDKYKKYLIRNRKIVEQEANWQNNMLVIEGYFKSLLGN